MNKIVPLMIVMLVFGASMVSAVVTLTAPAASGTVTGETYVLNASETTECSDDDFCNITYYAMSASTANSSWEVLATLGDHNVSELDANTTFNSSSLEDSNDYIFNVTIINASDASDEGQDTSSGVTVDNTNPVAPSSPSPSTGESAQVGSATTFSVTVTGAQTTGCTAAFSGTDPEGSSPYTMTHTGNTCSVSITPTATGTGTWTVTASDGTDTAVSSTWDIQFAVGGGGGGGGPTPYTQSSVSPPATTDSSPAPSTDSESEGLSPLMTALLVGVVVYFIVESGGKSGGKRRRKR